jgi:anti-sigma regulatory factor (Ser/Thr protein kinase)
VTLLGGSGPLTDVVEEHVDRLPQALAEEPRGVLCDLTDATGGARSRALRLLGSSGRYVREWPGVPVAICCRTADLRDQLLRQPMSEHLIVGTSLQECRSVLDRRDRPTIARVRLHPHPTASRRARDFVSRTCLDWGLVQDIGSACLVVSELVTNVVQHAATDMDLSLARHQQMLRVAVRDRSPSWLKPQLPDREQVRGRGIILVDGFSRAWGVLPAVNGKVAWAVLDA